MSIAKLTILLAAAAYHDTAPAAAVPSVEIPPVYERGLASWYGDGKMHGRVTASGEEIDPDRFTCAHRSLPLQTSVLLVNARDPERRVWCRINDRGPFGATTSSGKWVVKMRADDPGQWRGVLDISVAAARELGTYEQGLQPIEIRAWSRDERAPRAVAVNSRRRFE